MVLPSLRWLQSLLLSLCVLLAAAANAASAANANTVRVGVLSAFPPFQVWPANAAEPGGADMELLSQVLPRLGLQVQRVRFERHDELEAALRERKIDLAMAVGRSPEREEFMAFSAPYAEVEQALLTRRDQTSATVAPDLAGRRVGTIRGYVSEGLLKREFPQTQRQSFDSIEAAIEALQRGEIDAVFETLPALQQVVEQKGIEGLRILRSFRFDEGRLRLAMRKDDARLPALSQAFNTLAEAQVQRAIANWSAAPALTSVPSRFSLSPGDASALASAGALRVGLVREYRPYSYVDEAGQMQGLSVDLLRELERRTGLRIDSIKPYTLAELLAALRSGEVDMAFGLTDTLARRDAMLFVGPYLSFPLVIVASPQSGYYSLAQMQGARLALPAGYFAAPVITARFPGIQIITCRVSHACLKELEAGRADAMLTDVASAAQRLRLRSGGMALEVVGLAEEGLVDQHSIALRPEMRALAPVLKAALDDVIATDLPVLKRRWMNSAALQVGVPVQQAWRAAAIAAGLILTLVLAWAWHSRSLKREVEQRRSAQSAAEQATQQRERYLAFLAHEVRNSLNAVIGGLTLSRESVPGAQAANPASTQAGSVLAMAEASTRSTLGLLNELLDYSRLDAGKLGIVTAPAQLNALLTNVATELRPAALAKGLALELELPAKDDWHLIDTVRVGQIVRNLLSNAIKFTPSGRVRLGLHLGGVLDGQQALRIVVQDSGPGVDPAMGERLFMPYEQSDAHRGSGTGLGLALSRQLALAMGGDLLLLPQTKDGARFELRLNAATAAPLRAPAPAAAALAQALPGQLRLLLVEDAPAYALVLQHAFESIGWQVQLADSVDGALRSLAQHPADVLLSDLHLPDGTAHDLLQRLAPLRQLEASAPRRRPGRVAAMRLLVMSAAVEEAEAAELKATGALALLDKRFDAQEMLRGVLAAIGDDPAHDPD
jgi:two-component system, NarL family, sensor histidine kinase EvgS